MRGNSSSWEAAKIILSAATPIQKLIDPGNKTHSFINSQAISILENENNSPAVSFLRGNIGIINRGTDWADNGWKCFAHYYNPYREEGLSPWPNALVECGNYFKLSLDFLNKKKINKSLFFLGAAAHLVQDLCVPHHSRCIAFNGHQKFEKWAAKNYLDFTIDRNGIYYLNDTDKILKHNSIISYGLYDNVCRYDTNKYHEAALILLPLAQRTSAGLFYLYTGFFD
ncbi:broad-substrate range phospholipase C [Desulfocucumis palustris]|uniref:Phospholipase C n=1 Tax=Desulfocucumis palustris TaxID=1898651 RepID=A0A2L2XAZ2_9FIRM|nr:zinc dependent phospholipase C family protein [Desulfocucumis palustris]GBF33242.1 broad-substrate range phospholipase C [Desulfocucumis palustris]